jgi:hypothetical protein
VASFFFISVVSCLLALTKFVIMHDIKAY